MSEDKIINLLEEGRKILEKQGKINAVMYFDKCIEKYPTEGRLYWGRFCAKNNISYLCNKEEYCGLLRKGVYFIKDEDFAHAIDLCENGLGRDVIKDKEAFERYGKLAINRNNMAKELVTILSEKRKKEIAMINLKEIIETSKVRFNLLENQGKDLFEKMKEAEENVSRAYADCKIVSNDGIRVMNLVMERLQAIKSELEAESVPDGDAIKAYEKKLYKCSMLISDEKEECKEFMQLQQNKLLEKRWREKDQIQAQIEKVKSEMNELGTYLQTQTQKINKINLEYSDIKQTIDIGDFFKASNKLSSEEFEELLIKYQE